jgi:very-short-patch-repair endonuclease
MPEKAEMARALRRNMTPQEGVLWRRLRGNRLCGLHFRRQQVVSGFITDFYCHGAALAVEIDGCGHDAERDEERDQVFAGLGIRVIRFRNAEVMRSIERVLQRIVEAANLPPDPLPKREGRTYPLAPSRDGKGEGGPPSPRRRGARGEVKTK